MKIMSLSSAAAIAMLAIAGSAWADEPGSIGSYKSEVAKHVSAWTIEMDRYNGQLERVLKDANVIHELKVKTLKARQDAEKAFNELQRAKQELEKSMADLVASLVVATGEVVAHPTDANKVKVAALNVQKIAKEKEIENNTVAIKMMEPTLDRKQHEDRHQDANIAQVKDDIKDINGKIGLAGAVLNISDIPSPVRRDPKVLDKDPKTNKYRAEWGPVLAQFIKDQINGVAQKENHIKVSVQVSWSQADFATGRAPYFNYSAAAIDPPNLTQ